MRNLLVFSLAIIGLTTTAQAQQAVPVTTRPTPSIVTAGDPTVRNVGNLADVQQQSNGRTTDYDAFVNQAGAGNEATVRQAASATANGTLVGLADIRQTGANNSASIDQLSTRRGTENAYITQQGNQNVASAKTQSGSNDGNIRTTRQEQIGSDNEAFITVSGTRDKDNVSQIQTGDGNYARVAGDTGNGSDGLTQTQTGNNNTAEFLGGNNQGTGGIGGGRALQTQVGNGNTAYYQSGTAFDSDVTMTQTGDFNNTYTFGVGQRSTISTTQTGNSNDIDASFGGKSDNTLTASQTGNMNNIDVIFTSGNNEALATQNGNGGNIVINQGN